MTVPMKTSKEIGKQLNKAFSPIGVAIDKIFSPSAHGSKMMTTLEFDWPALTEYHLTQSNIKPVEATTIELDAEIERLKADLAFNKQTLINYQKSTQVYIDDYKNLEVDYKNSQFANKNLQAQVNQIPALKRTIQFLMSEHLDIRLGDE